MVQHSASSDYFLDHYRVVTKKVSDALRGYLGDPSEDRTHALRSSLRRLDASIRLLPKKARKDRQVKNYEERCRKILKLTSPIRDLDLLLARLRLLEGGPAVSLLTRRATNRRGKVMKNSMKASWKLFELAVPKLRRGDLAGIDARINDTMIELDGEIARLLPKVTASESNIEELHSLRIRSKRLRYMIEAVPPSVPRTKAAEVLCSWQDILGRVHDSDALIETFNREALSPSVRKLLRAERKRRHSQYLKFQRAYEATFGSGEDRSRSDSVFFRHAPKRARSFPRSTGSHHQR